MIKFIESLLKRKEIELTPEQEEEIRIQSFFDRISPSVIKFNADHFICGNTYQCVWAIREYAPSIDEQAILSHIADHENVTLHIYNRIVDNVQQGQIIRHATRKNSVKSNTNDVVQAFDALSNQSDVAEMLAELRRNKESLMHTVVYILLKSSSLDKLKELQSDLQMEITRSKIQIDELLLQQKEGFLSALPFGSNVFKEQFERVMPASSTANLYPLNYSGKTDEHGIYLGKDKYGSSVCVDFNKRSEDKTNSNILILGNAGEGKSFLLKLILMNIRESGFAVLNIDPDNEYSNLIEKLGGVNIDLMGGLYTINPLEPKPWADEADETSEIETFRQVSPLSQHISYLKDFFRAYKDFDDPTIDTLEIMLEKLYKNFGIDDNTDLEKIEHTKFPLLSDLYDLIDFEYKNFDEKRKTLYRADVLQALCLGLYSLCKGSESKYFNGHTNIKDGRLINFQVKGIMDINHNIRDTILFNLLSYMQHCLLKNGRTFGFVDELHLFLNNLTSINYLRTIMKQDRKKDSGLGLASQNVEDLMLPGVKEYTKPLLSIPTHQFLFYPGIVSADNYIDTLQLEQSEYQLINRPSRSHCLYRCGNERYHLKVIAPEYKSLIIGKSGGR